MKRIAKTVTLFVLLVAVGLGGYSIGRNTMPLPEEMANLGLGDQGVPLDEQEAVTFDTLHQLREVIKEKYLFDYTDEMLNEGMMRGLFAALGDPYSTYMNGEEFTRMMEDTSGEFAGVGIVVRAGDDGMLTVVSTIPDSPSAKADVLPDDKILAVDDENYTAEQMEAAVQKIRGEVGTTVKITLQRQTDKGTQVHDVTLTRAMIHTESVIAKMLEDQVGYMQINSFDEPTGQDFQTKLEELKKQGAKRLVLDLRNNPGGLLDASVNVADQLLGEGEVVKTVTREGSEEVLRSDAKQETLPIVVLVNGGSASASEVLLGALHDYQRVLSVGTKTFGKGIVQQLYPMGDSYSEGGFKLTVAEYLTPKGTHVHGTGITPDVVVELGEGVRYIGVDYLQEDNQLQTAIALVKLLEDGKPAVLPKDFKAVAPVVAPATSQSAGESDTSQGAPQQPTASELPPEEGTEGNEE